MDAARRRALGPGRRPDAARAPRSRSCGRRCTSSASRARTGGFCRAARSGLIRVVYDDDGRARSCCCAAVRAAALPGAGVRDGRPARARALAHRARRARVAGRPRRRRLPADRRAPLRAGRRGTARVHVEVEVANFYPALASGVARWIYSVTQSRIHVIVTHGFLRSLARLDLARVGRRPLRTPGDVPDPQPPHEQIAGVSGACASGRAGCEPDTREVAASCSPAAAGHRVRRRLPVAVLARGHGSHRRSAQRGPGGLRRRTSCVRRRDDGVVVGEIGYSFDAADGDGDAGLLARRAVLGPRLCDRRRCGRCSRTCATDPRVQRITAQTPVGHVASRRVMEKAGMTLARQRLGEVDGELVELADLRAG